ncbi:hypothetical protein LRD18_01995 [Halorhodospira halochloris]|uniref:hypothetical protein n=1 Tax=Halorhodospira halochloris TaxID=1052 RepID=UPI001EE987CC|nr:hypothetical protein [Halorhodospira halochloris]MCG5529645.1 hypothetical protein [Halorhodospira halochloris]
MLLEVKNESSGDVPNRKTVNLEGNLVARPGEDAIKKSVGAIAISSFKSIFGTIKVALLGSQEVKAAAEVEESFIRQEAADFLESFVKEIIEDKVIEAGGGWLQQLAHGDNPVQAIEKRIEQVQATVEEIDVGELSGAAAEGVANGISAAGDLF